MYMYVLLVIESKWPANTSLGMHSLYTHLPDCHPNRSRAFVGQTSERSSWWLIELYNEKVFIARYPLLTFCSLCVHVKWNSKSQVFSKLCVFLFFFSIIKIHQYFGLFSSGIVINLTCYTVLNFDHHISLSSISLFGRAVIALLVNICPKMRRFKQLRKGEKKQYKTVPPSRLEEVDLIKIQNKWKKATLIWSNYWLYMKCTRFV